MSDEVEFRRQSSLILLRNCRIFDGYDSELAEGRDVLIENDRIKEISDRQIRTQHAREIDVRGRVLMPGLIDCHVHACLSSMRIADLEEISPTLMAAQAAEILRGMLDRGFTTVRDTGGADWGLREAVERGLIAGPRLFISGRPLSQTGGHGDFRRRDDESTACSCASALHLNFRVADGVPEVRKAARQELRRGANQIKVMISGGVASPHDPLHNCQYSSEELTAVVEEANAWNTYVLAHAYSPRAILHGLKCGVRTFEHANLIDRESASRVAEAGAYVVPTLITYSALAEQGRQSGLSAFTLGKLDEVRRSGLASLEVSRDAGVKLGFGTDLLGPSHEAQSREFLLRSEVLTPLEILRSATSTNAEILRCEGDLGTVAVGAKADLLVVDGNPLEDLGLLAEQGRHLSVILKDGRLHKYVP